MSARKRREIALKAAKSPWKALDFHFSIAALAAMAASRTIGRRMNQPSDQQ
jgi:hypothetical protein